jgi:hypothetical protein
MAHKTNPPLKANSAERVKPIKRYLERVVWASIVPSLRRRKMAKAERESILGIDPDGYPEQEGTSTNSRFDSH